MNPYGKKQAQKRKNIKGSLLLGVLICILTLVGCQKDTKKAVAKKFIETQINCGTYLGAAGDEEVLKKVFLEFFSEESYEQYLDDVFGYLYPQLFYVLNVSRSKIDKIKCIDIKKGQDCGDTYEFEVQYTMIEYDEINNKQIKKVKMKDYLQITIDAEEKIQQVIILNTSDVIKKLVLDVKIQ